jgi:CDP-glucose 4,6-dehydratase
MKQPFWRGKRVLVTGHTGFKGSWLCLWLETLGAEVRGYALDPPTTPSLFELAQVGKGLHSMIGDVRDADRLRSTLQSFRPDVVLHLAAQTLVLASYEDPVGTYSTNVLGTVNLLEAVRLGRRPCVVVNITSDKCYENRGWVWGYRETDVLGGHDPYSNSKACSELVTRAYRESFFPVTDLDRHGVALATARAGNVIAGGDWTPHQLVPDVVAAFAVGSPVQLRSPTAVRPWQHVLDCLSGYLALAEALATNPEQYSSEWNIGPADTDAQPVSYLVEVLAKKWGIDRAWVRAAGSNAHEAHQLRVDSSKARAHLSWRCRLPLDAALDWVAEWYRRWLAGEPARRLCEEQISRYTDLMTGP